MKSSGRWEQWWRIRVTDGEVGRMLQGFVNRNRGRGFEKNMGKR